MKKLLLTPAIALPFFLVSCSQSGGPGDTGGGLPPPPQNGSGAAVDSDGAPSKVSAPTSYRPERAWPQKQRREGRRADTSTSAS